jgi:hypothetical protein
VQNLIIILYCIHDGHWVHCALHVHTLHIHELYAVQYTILILYICNTMCMLFVTVIIIFVIVMPRTALILNNKYISNTSKLEHIRVFFFCISYTVLLHSCVKKQQHAFPSFLKPNIPFFSLWILNGKHVFRKIFLLSRRY